MMSATLRELRRERWAAQSVAVPVAAPDAPMPHTGLAALLRLAMAELFASRRPAHD